MPYYIKFDFDCENEPPKVEIVNDTGCSVIEVYEEPILVSADNEWSWEQEDWQPGPFAVKLLELINAGGPYTINEPDPRW